MLSKMIEAKRILDKHGLEFWLDGGTLLWAYRDGTPDETDTDFAINAKDTQAALDVVQDFVNEGWTLYKIWEFTDGIREVSFIKDGKKVDIFIKHIGKEWAYHLATDIQASVVYKQPAHHFDHLDTLEMGGETWNIPTDTDNYLTTYYGDWKTHIDVTTWDWTKSSPCIDREWKV